MTVFWSATPPLGTHASLCHSFLLSLPSSGPKLQSLNPSPFRFDLIFAVADALRVMEEGLKSDLSGLT